MPQEWVLSDDTRQESQTQARQLPGLWTHPIDSRSWFRGMVAISTPSMAIFPVTRCWSMPRNRASTADDFPEPVLQTGLKLANIAYPQFRDGYLPAADTNFQPALQIEREVFERKWEVAAARHIRLCMSEMGVTIPIFHREIYEG
jgi:hypothetical protein